MDALFSCDVDNIDDALRDVCRISKLCFYSGTPNCLHVARVWCHRQRYWAIHTALDSELFIGAIHICDDRRSVPRTACYSPTRSQL